MPFLSKWTKLVDPAEDNLDVHSRFSDSGARIFPDGSYYRGPFKNGKMNTEKGGATGFFKSDDFWVVGEFKDNMPHGSAKIEHTSKASSKTGQGAGTSSPLLSAYEGQWVEGVRAGQGVMTNSEKNVRVRGNFADDVPHGSEISIECSKGREGALLQFQKYVGGAENGIPSGSGEMIFWDGATYKGAFQSGCRDGKGLIKQGDVVAFDGQWKQDLPSGRATRVVYENKTCYSGDIWQGKRKGHGQLYADDAKGLIYDGLWKDDVPEGRGTLYAEDGEYEGDFKAGKRHGKGRFVYASTPGTDGRHRAYEGDWENDVQHGVGSYLDEHGMRATYRYEEGVMDEQSRQQYKARCGKAPAKIVEQGVQPSGIEGVPVSHWGDRMRLDPAGLKSVMTGPLSWKKFVSHPVELNTAVFEPASSVPVIEDPPAR